MTNLRRAANGARSTRQSLTVDRLLFRLILFILLGLMVVVTYPGWKLQFVKMLDRTPPQVTVSVQISGRTIAQSVIEITPATEILPVVRVSDRMDSSPNVFLSLHPRRMMRTELSAFPFTTANGSYPPPHDLPIGVPITMNYLGEFVLSATASDASGNMTYSNAITIKVTERQGR